MRTSSKNTSQKSSPPCIMRSGRASMPGARMSINKYEMPACFAASGSVRNKPNIMSATVALAGPDLLAVHDPLVALEHRARLERCEVAARAGLAVALAPVELADQRLRDVGQPLRFRAALEQRRNEHVRALSRRAIAALRRASKRTSDHRLGHNVRGLGHRHRRPSEPFGSGSPPRSRVCATRSHARARSPPAASGHSRAECLDPRDAALRTRHRTGDPSRFFLYHALICAMRSRCCVGRAQPEAIEHHALEPELDVALPGEADAAVASTASRATCWARSVMCALASAAARAARSAGAWSKACAAYHQSPRVGSTSTAMFAS